MKPDLIVAEDPTTGHLADIAITEAANVREAEFRGQHLHPNRPDQNLDIYGLHEPDRAHSHAWIHSNRMSAPYPRSGAGVVC